MSRIQTCMYTQGIPHSGYNRKHLANGKWGPGRAERSRGNSKSVKLATPNKKKPQIMLFTWQQGEPDCVKLPIDFDVGQDFPEAEAEGPGAILVVPTAQYWLPSSLWPHNYFYLSVSCAIVFALFNVLTLTVTSPAMILASFVSSRVDSCYWNQLQWSICCWSLWDPRWSVTYTCAVDIFWLLQKGWPMYVLVQWHVLLSPFFSE